MHRLALQGARVVVLDDLSTGDRRRIPTSPLVIGDISDSRLVKDVLGDFGIHAVAHLAAKTDVNDSVLKPLNYYTANTSGTISLLTSCLEADVSKIVFSSTAAIYGLASAKHAVNEVSATRPINPYGASKLMAERILVDAAISSGIRHVTLRCFNIAGSGLHSDLFLPTKGPKHLINAACEVVAGRMDAVTIFGTDLPTPDGTGVRDYVHVDDVASALVNAINYLDDGGTSLTLNCGSGRGYSVREVLLAAERASGVNIPIIEASRRDADPPSLISDTTRIRDKLQWTPRHHDLDLIVRSALRAALCATHGM